MIRILFCRLGPLGDLSQAIQSPFPVKSDRKPSYSSSPVVWIKQSGELAHHRVHTSPIGASTVLLLSVNFVSVKAVQKVSYRTLLQPCYCKKCKRILFQFCRLNWNIALHPCLQAKTSYISAVTAGVTYLGYFCGWVFLRSFSPIAKTCSGPPLAVTSLASSLPQGLGRLL